MHRCTQSKYNGKPLEHTRTDARKVNTMGNHWNTHTRSHTRTESKYNGKPLEHTRTPHPLTHTPTYSHTPTNTQTKASKYYYLPIATINTIIILEELNLKSKSGNNATGTLFLSRVIREERQPPKDSPQTVSIFIAANCRSGNNCTDIFGNSSAMLLGS